MRSLLLGPTTSGSANADAGLLIVRVVAGLSLALGHGLGKIPPTDGFIQRTAGMGFPAPELFAWLAAFAEFGGGLLLALGLLTRPMALLVVGQTLVIVFLAHAGDPFAAREKGVLFMGIALLLAAAGPGRYSIDRALSGALSAHAEAWDESVERRAGHERRASVDRRTPASGGLHELPAMSRRI